MHFLCSFVIAPLSSCNTKHLNARFEGIFPSVTDSILGFLQKIRYKLGLLRRRDRKVMSHLDTLFSGPFKQICQITDHPGKGSDPHKNKQMPN